MRSIPRSDADFDLWLSNFIQFCNATKSEAGLTAGQIHRVNEAYANWHAAFALNIDLHAKAKGARREKNLERKAAERIARRTARIIQANPEVTDAHRAKAGLALADIERRPQPEDIVFTTPPPLIRLDWSMRSRVAVHFGPNPSNPRRNGLPKGMRGCRVWYTICEENETLTLDDAIWHLLGDSTRSPYVHVLDSKYSLTVLYRAQYLDRKLRAGPFGEEVRVTVTM